MIASRSARCPDFHFQEKLACTTKACMIASRRRVTASFLLPRRKRVVCQRSTEMSQVSRTSFVWLPFICTRYQHWLEQWLSGKRTQSPFRQPTPPKCPNILRKRLGCTWKKNLESWGVKSWTGKVSACTKSTVDHCPPPSSSNVAKVFPSACATRSPLLQWVNKESNNLAPQALRLTLKKKFKKKTLFGR